MTVEEIGFEPPPRRRGLAPWGWLLAAGLVVVVVWLVVSRGSDGEATPAGSPSASPSSPSPSRSEWQQPGIAEARFQLGEVCSPRATRQTLAVRFTLVNPSPADLILLRVVPELPLDGLQLQQTTVTFGGCQDELGPVYEEPTVAAGGSVLVVFTFTLPPTCPQALPVAADVTSRVYDVSGSGQRVVIPIYADLGGVDFPTCP